MHGTYSGASYALQASESSLDAPQVHAVSRADDNHCTLVASGAFGKVFKLINRTDGRLYAVKEIDKRNLSDTSKLSREVEIMKCLNHPSVVRYFDFRDEDITFKIFMEYIPHGHLDEYMNKAGGAIDESTTKLLADQLFDALQYVHSERIVH